MTGRHARPAIMATAAPTREQLAEARSWIADCEWADDTSGLTDAQVVRGIGRHYAGGWAQFLKDGAWR
jgi:hypothetical protein